MKTLLFCIGTTMAVNALALIVRPATLPPSPWADTEASTNVPLGVLPQGVQVKEFRVGLSFLATPSNNVQVSFGRDADGDGVLSGAETDLKLGWDCGTWMLGMEPRRETATTNNVKDLTWTLRMRTGTPYALHAAECDTSLVAVTNQPGLSALYDPAWDLMRITVRGVDVATEQLEVAAFPWGCVLRFR